MQCSVVGYGYGSRGTVIAPAMMPYCWPRQLPARRVNTLSSLAQALVLPVWPSPPACPG
jgi:hypothetical protein